MNGERGALSRRPNMTMKKKVFFLVLLIAICIAIGFISVYLFPFFRNLSRRRDTTKTFPLLEGSMGEIESPGGELENFMGEAHNGIAHAESFDTITYTDVGHKYDDCFESIRASKPSLEGMEFGNRLVKHPLVLNQYGQIIRRFPNDIASQEHMSEKRQQYEEQEKRFLKKNDRFEKKIEENLKFMLPYLNYKINIADEIYRHYELYYHGFSRLKFVAKGNYANCLTSCWIRVLSILDSPQIKIKPVIYVVGLILPELVFFDADSSVMFRKQQQSYIHNILLIAPPDVSIKIEPGQNLLDVFEGIKPKEREKVLFSDLWNNGLEVTVKKMLKPHERTRFYTKQAWTVELVERIVEKPSSLFDIEDAEISDFYDKQIASLLKKMMKYYQKLAAKKNLAERPNYRRP